LAATSGKKGSSKKGSTSQMAPFFDCQLSVVNVQFSMFLFRQFSATGHPAERV